MKQILDTFMLMAWVLTLPVSMMLAGLLFRGFCNIF